MGDLSEDGDRYGYPRDYGRSYRVESVSKLGHKSKARSGKTISDRQDLDSWVFKLAEEGDKFAMSGAVPAPEAATEELTEAQESFQLSEELTEAKESFQPSFPSTSGPSVTKTSATLESVSGSIEPVGPAASAAGSAMANLKAVLNKSDARKSKRVGGDPPAREG